MSIAGISAGTAVAILTLNSSSFTAGLKSAGQQLRTFADGNNNAQQRINALGGAMTTVGVSMVKSFTLPIVGAGAAAVKTAADFEEGMDKVSAISGATGEDLEKLSNKAKEMGAKTKFSATEASDALSYMAMAGWKTNDMLDGLEGIMNLAAASGEELALVSDIVTNEHWSATGKLVA